MSKASEWKATSDEYRRQAAARFDVAANELAMIDKRAPQFQFGRDAYEIPRVAKVNAEGNLLLENGVASPVRAIEFARWILDTFEDAPDAPPPAQP